VSVIVLDTDVASKILKDRLTDPLRSRLAGHSLCITFVTLAELSQWRVIRDWGPRRMASFDAWRHRVGLLPYDEAIAIKWGEIQGNAHLRGRPPRSTTVGSPPVASSTAYASSESNPSRSARDSERRPSAFQV
jgi:predicted nucleic acid-binding protein